MDIVLPITLTSAAAAALINIWLAARIGQLRLATKTVHGDDAGGPLSRRMRAQLNFVENTAFVLILIAAIELAGNGGLWLSITAGVYMLARVAHGIGMDGEGPTLLRKIGVIVTFGTQLFLAGYAVGITLAVI
ncbi:hypothetical protein GCM10022600_22820 [Qipengyuania pelagi]|jgi:uncharacterized protein|uniref:MAPEG family protein n=1 Tax=Qipengyuania pelagi TaxID=994320 RepID=A0A844Y4W6_9SPHN|nr:MAPEG family protein [Qipengyuania pelagi]MEC7818399.1 MAPEG family protein [Pseudomonadota bacterium]MXO52876.1 MAPEG family protein [Qipengyuania pelagi]